MNRLELIDLVIGFRRDAPLAAPISAALHPGEILGIMGPSGCGKTTLLRVVGGFAPALGGDVLIDGEKVGEVAPGKRTTAMVFQDYALFPRMTVADNVLLGVRSGTSERRRRNAAEELIARMGLAELRDAPAARLSGGQKQRVALARALSVQPRVLLLDEPLSALDLPRREELRCVLDDARTATSMSALLVTHSFDDVAALATKVAFWVDRTVTEARSVGEWVRDPRAATIARAVGYRNFVPSDLLDGKSRSMYALRRVRLLSDERVQSTEKRAIGTVANVVWRDLRLVAAVDVGLVRLDVDVPAGATPPRVGETVAVALEMSDAAEVS